MDELLCESGLCPSAVCDPQLFCGCSVVKSCPALYDPKDCRMPGFPVLQYLPESVSQLLMPRKLNASMKTTRPSRANTKTPLRIPFYLKSSWLNLELRPQ